MLPLSADKLNDFSRTAVHGSQWQSLVTLKMLALNRDGLWPLCLCSGRRCIRLYKKIAERQTALGYHVSIVQFVGIIMCQAQSATAFRPAVSPDDWKIIMSAIEAYSHNAQYRDLLGRLERQAVLNGIKAPQRFQS